MNKHEEPRFEPDIRFLLANERTLLAWVRTSLGLLAGGLVVAHIGDDITDVQKVLAMIIIAIGAAMAVVGYVRYRAADQAIRAGQLPSIGHAPLLQAAGVVLVSVALIIMIAADL